ncbi:siderophore iron transporter mirA [Durotheca rogersii]|uniref:siderophore iron transporter mirA n=1 Tax=Durotheca rogersii TaxID=419775 RepID=UPI00221F6EF9|nr:siderophore iron transporter mirA [Durotheca rogersii]KAI5865563.1 siderophore iron transporter mirA [Durotheca rogersii]
MSKHPDVVLEDGRDDESLEKSAGVTQSDALKRSSRKWVITAYIGLYLMTFVLAFDTYSTGTYSAYATSDFKGHSLLSASRVVRTITSMLAHPIVAKLTDMIGRIELFAISISLSVLSLVLFASSQNVETYFVAGFFDAVGGTGFSITQQIFISDLTTLRNRGLWLSLPDSISSIPTLYLGTIVADAFLAHSTWRWGYGMWAIVHPVAAIPLLLTLFLWQHHRRKTASGPPKVPLLLRDIQPGDSIWTKIYKVGWVELDFLGCLLLIAGLSLILVPVSLTGSQNSMAWSQPHFIAMLVVGCVLFVLFFVWDSLFAKKPFIPFRLVRHKTVMAACALCVFDLTHYALFSVFFPSYLQVAAHYSPGHAGRIDNSLRVAFQISSLVVAVLMHYSKRAKIWILFGATLCVLGQGLQIYFVNIDGTHPANEASFVTAKTLVGIGRGFYQTAAQVCVQAVVNRDEVAVATGVYFASMSLGGAIGTSISGSIWRSNLLPKLSQYLPEASKSRAESIFQSIVVAQRFAVGTAERDAIDLAYRETQRLLAIAATCALAPMLLVMWFIKNVDLVNNKQEKGQDGEGHGTSDHSNTTEERENSTEKPKT